MFELWVPLNTNIEKIRMVDFSPPPMRLDFSQNPKWWSNYVNVVQQSQLSHYVWPRDPWVELLRSPAKASLTAFPDVTSPGVLTACGCRRARGQVQPPEPHPGPQRAHLAARASRRWSGSGSGPCCTSRSGTCSPSSGCCAGPGQVVWLGCLAWMVAGRCSHSSWSWAGHSSRSLRGQGPHSLRAASPGAMGSLGAFIPDVLLPPHFCVYLRSHGRPNAGRASAVRQQCSRPEGLRPASTGLNLWTHPPIYFQNFWAQVTQRNFRLLVGWAETGIIKPKPAMYPTPLTNTRHLQGTLGSSAYAQPSEGQRESHPWHMLCGGSEWRSFLVEELE